MTTECTDGTGGWRGRGTTWVALVILLLMMRKTGSNGSTQCIVILRRLQRHPSQQLEPKQSNASSTHHLPRCAREPCAQQQRALHQQRWPTALTTSASFSCHRVSDRAWHQAVCRELQRWSSHRSAAGPGMHSSRNPRSPVVSIPSQTRQQQPGSVSTSKNQDDDDAYLRFLQHAVQVPPAAVCLANSEPVVLVVAHECAFRAAARQFRTTTNDPSTDTIFRVHDEKAHVPRIIQDGLIFGAYVDHAEAV